MQICRLCRHTVTPFLDLGRVPLPEEFRTKREQSTPIKTYPLGLSYCAHCTHVQLTHPVNPDPIYKKNYFYDYSVTDTGFNHWQTLSTDLMETYELKKNDLVVDIGSNTGTVLSQFQKYGMKIIGVDPASRLVAIARKRGVPTINDYFSSSVAKRIIKTDGDATVVICTNVFDHVHDIDDVTKGIKTILSPHGVCIIEIPYFYRMLTTLSHIVYHQQLDYMMVTPLIPYFQRHGLDIVDANEIPIHGGSLRLTIRHTGVQRPSTKIKHCISREQPLLKNYSHTLNRFRASVIKQQDDLVTLIHTLKKQHAHIAAVGASAKGITLLHYGKLGKHDIDFITEKSPLKIGRFTPTGIPIVPDTELIKKQPEYALLLAWNFKDEIIGNLKAYKGTWIIPVPKLTIIT